MTLNPRCQVLEQVLSFVACVMADFEEGDTLPQWQRIGGYIVGAIYHSEGFLVEIRVYKEAKVEQPIKIQLDGLLQQMGRTGQSSS